MPAERPVAAQYSHARGRSKRTGGLGAFQADLVETARAGYMKAAMFAALSKTIAQISDPAFRSVLLRALGLSTLVFLALWVASWLGFGWLGGLLGDWIAEQGASGFWAEIFLWIFGAASIAGVFVTSFLLFPAVAAIAIGLFLDDIAEAVEQRHHPNLPAARDQPWAEMIGGTASFAAVTVLANIVALPFYLLLLFVPPLNLFLYYGLNGYLLGREYFELVAVRRMDAKAAKTMRRRFRGKVFLAGVIIAFMLSIPIINLLAPIVATGFLVHVFHDLQRHPKAVGIA